jgi:hypothetical protein
MKLLIPFCIALCFGNCLSAQEPQSMTNLRSNRPALSPERSYYLTDAGRQGLFTPDPADRTSPDDSAMTIVTTSGIRLKRVVEGKALNVRWFGASGNGVADDQIPIQKAIDYITTNGYTVRTLYFPQGTYRITRPLLIAKFDGSKYTQVSITLEGPANSKDLSTGNAIIAPTFNNTFAIGIQLGKGVQIKDLTLRGKFTFPNHLNEIQVDTLSFREWTDGATRDNQRSPYSGIVIDPFSDPAAYPSTSDMYPDMHKYYPPGLNRGGSTAIQVIGCMIYNFVVGVMITPSNQWNGELIDVIDCDISNNKVAYAMGQAQSKECHVERIKCWGNTHTIFDNRTYGMRHGDGAGVPMVDGVNIAGYAKQLCNIGSISFNGVFRNVYAEGLWRLGYINGIATLSFEDCQLDFSTLGEGRPYPDFFVLGSGASFHGCIMRHYTGAKGMRLVLSGGRNFYEGGVMNEPPVAANLDNCGNCPTPNFRNISMYYTGGTLGNQNWGQTTVTHAGDGLGSMAYDPVYYGNTYLLKDPLDRVDLMYRFTYNNTYERTVPLSGTPVIHTSTTQWTGYFKLTKEGDAALLRPGDIVLTAGLPYQDQYTNQFAPAYPIGFIKKIGHDTVYLRNLAYGIREGMQLSLWSDYYIAQKGPLTGDIAAGSNKLINVQGQFPAAGERIDIPMLPTGAYVTQVDPAARTVTFSHPNNSGRSYTDYTFINGYPTVEMHSAYDLPALQKAGKTLVGAADFYLYDLIDKNVHDPAYLLGSGFSARYKNLHTHIAGDTTLHKLSYTPVSR